MHSRHWIGAAGVQDVGHKQEHEKHKNWPGLNKLYSISVPS
jgi:hypothetical protein